jgi:hypothetical protein
MLTVDLSTSEIDIVSGSCLCPSHRDGDNGQHDQKNEAPQMP